ncbi:leucine zipper domain-containing protein [Nitrobacter vulgaris]|uniref:leucine zipper domain-containing protein n=1 Tax=Nitrobacter vulgaris TaxID=29421 RepID=UPI0035B54377
MSIWSGRAKTVAKWANRFHTEGTDGLRDRSSRPHFSPDQTNVRHLRDDGDITPAAPHRPHSPPGSVSRPRPSTAD